MLIIVFWPNLADSHRIERVKSLYFFYLYLTFDFLFVRIVFALKDASYKSFKEKKRH